MEEDVVLEGEFDPTPESVALVRDFVRDALGESSLCDEVVLASSELASNVVRHARTRFTVRLIRNHDVVRLEVEDGSSILPAVAELSEFQWGLRMIEGLSRDWGVDVTDEGKSVWVEFDGAAGD